MLLVLVRGVHKSADIPTHTPSPSLFLLINKFLCVFELCYVFLRNTGPFFLKQNELFSIGTRSTVTKYLIWLSWKSRISRWRQIKSTFNRKSTRNRISISLIYAFLKHLTSHLFWQLFITIRLLWQAIETLVYEI